MFPSVGIKDEQIKDKIKQRQWDERLGTKSGIPEYSPLNDKHTKSYKKVITPSPSKYEEESLNKNKKTTFFQKRMELADQLKATHTSHINSIEEYEELASKYKIPSFFIYYTLLPLLDVHDPNAYLFAEKKSLKQQSSYYHKITTAVTAREECLERLRKTISHLQQQDLLKDKNQLQEEIKHLRFLTTNAIDQIKRWRDHLGKVEDKPIYYTNNQENYLLKILNDNKFIFASKLSGVLYFAEKNDPFLLVPIKKAEGKQASMFTDIVQIQKQFTFYQKYMQYLASQKAFELNLNPTVKVKQISKNPLIEKIYKTNHFTPKIETLANYQKKQDEQDDEEYYKNIELQKVREERLKRNQERMKSIKNIYQKYNRKSNPKEYKSQKKIPQTDHEGKHQSKKKYLPEKKVKKESDSQFEGLVKMKMNETQKESPIKKNRETKSMTKLIKSQDKMIQSLRDIQSTLRNKLQIIQQEEKKEVFETTQQRFGKKNNQQLIKQLKSEIMLKLEKETLEREKLKKKKRQEEEKVLEEIKIKMKKEMEEKLQQKKREKLIEREELEKKLKEEEERLNSQRQLEVQLQLKLSKEKQLRELEKIRRQSLEREKKFKDELEKEQVLRKQKQQIIQNQRKDKERLIEELKKRELKEQIQEELKKEMKQKNQPERTRSLMENDFELLKSQKQSELIKEIELLKHREGAEIEQIRRQNQLRERMLKLKRDEEELKRKEIEHLMKDVIQNQKEQLQRETMKQRIELEESMRNNVKEKLLEEYRNQKQALIESKKYQREKHLEEEVYREKIKQKIEREMRMDAIQRTKKQFQERENKKYQIKSKLETVKNIFDKEIVIDKNKIQEDVKKQLVEKVIFDKQAEKQFAKNDLRSQFQKELMASAVPQIYQSKDSFLVKNINYFQGDRYLENKIHDLKPTNQKPYEQNQIKSPLKNEVKELKSTLTNEQLHVYSKQKEKVNDIREDLIATQVIHHEEEQGFSLLKLDKSKKEEDQYQVKVIKMSSKQQDKIKRKENSNKKKNKLKNKSSSSDSEDIKYKKKQKKQSSKKNKRHYDDEEELDSEDLAKEKKKRKNKKVLKSSDSQAPESEEVKSPLKQKQIYKTSQDEIKNEKIKHTNPTKKESERQKQAIIHYDIESKSKVNLNQMEQVTIKPSKLAQNNDKFEIQLQAIPEGQLDYYLQNHMNNLPEKQLGILLIEREELYRKLIGQLTFCLLLGKLENKVIGMAFAYHDRSRSDLRKFSIVHLGAYRNEDIKDFLLCTTNYIFKKDPCDQIQFHYKFNEANPSQIEFSNDFNKWFDKYGSVFQKKIEDNLFERKYVLKRQFNQKCQVVLGGINKNTFRNIFSVYSSMLMSQTDMIQFKEELRDVLAPENQVSYAIMIAELFRTYLTPDEAQSLKGKVKQFAKLKQLLVLVVMLQKKKVKMQELKLSEYKNLIELNMKLMSQGKELIRYCKDSGVEVNRLYHCELNQGFNLPFHFQTTSLPVEAKQNQIRQISYFRLAPIAPFKLHIIKSSLYNCEMNILPTENNKYKIFVMNAQQYNEIKEQNHLDLFMYIRLFLKNVKSHNVAVWKYVWLPEMTDKGAWSVRQFKSFLNKDFYTHDSINISYRQFLPGALIIEPEHRDLVITPPFIVGIMSMTLEQVTEGSPLYARIIEVDALKTLEIQT